jgi:hypothetical protein
VAFPTEATQLAILAAAATIIAAIIGAYASLRAKIQQEAWKLAYTRKAQDIEDFHRTINRYGEVVCVLGESRGVPGPFGYQYNSIVMWIDQLWSTGPHAERMRRSLEFATKSVPMRITQDPPNAMEEAALKMMRTAFQNEVTTELVDLVHRLSELQGRLALSVRFPNVIARATAAVLNEHRALVGVDYKIDDFDFSDFPRRYSRALRGPRLALRRELRVSATSLRAVHKEAWTHRAAVFMRNPRRSVMTWWNTYYSVPEVFRGVERSPPK